MARHQRTRRAGQALIEALETRTLLSSTLVDGALLIRGTLGADSIVVSRVATEPSKVSVDVNGQVSEYVLSDVFRFYIRGLAGHDRIVIDQSNGEIATPARIWGGVGNDTIIGGAGRDTIYGDAGNDVIIDTQNRNEVHAGTGRVRFVGGPDSNTKLYSARKRLTNTGGHTGFIQFSNGLFRRVDETAPPRVQSSGFRPAGHNGIVTGYTVTQIRNAYGFGDLTDATFTNRGGSQNIAIVIAYDNPTVKADLDFFASVMGTGGLPDDQFFQVFAGGNRPVANEGWALELAMDVQWAHAMAPGANIIVVHADTALDWDMLAATDIAGKVIQDLGGGVVSMSFGMAEVAVPTLAAWEEVFQKYSKVSFIASSGDDGASLISYPATSPSVTAVGGTTLFLDAAGNRIGPEVGWDGSGGGLSSIFGTPGYQQGVRLNGITPIETIGQRVIPDIAMVADPATGAAVYITTPVDGDTGWFQLGGTSLSAPMFSGLVTLANELRAREGRPAIGSNLNAAIYNAGRVARDTSFIDITGDIDPLLGNGGFFSTPGYDAVTGWGVPIASSGGLIDRLAEPLGSYINTAITWEATFSPSLDSNPPIYLERTGGTGRIQGGTTLSAEFVATAFDPFRLNDNHLNDQINIIELYRRPDNTVYGYAQATIYGYQTAVGVVIGNIRIDGVITVGADGKESIKGTFFAIDQFGKRIHMSPFGRPANQASFEGTFKS